MKIDQSGVVSVGPNLIAPGDFALAKLLLSADELVTVRTLWTDAILTDWESDHVIASAPTIAERLAAAEMVLLELMIEGQ